MSLVTTGDGSHSYRSERFGELYHSRHGAIPESQHVFIDQGFLQFLTHPGIQEIRIFEMGLGTGLNVFMTYLSYLVQSKEHPLAVDYHAIDKYPLPEEEALKIPYPAELNARQHLPVFRKIHSCAWDEKIEIHPGFTFTKSEIDLRDFRTENEEFHLIYFDAFAPSAQPELWDETACKILAQLTAPGGILVSYCAQGQWKRNLKRVGFKVEALPGPPGKREMTRALYPPEAEN